MKIAIDGNDVTPELLEPEDPGTEIAVAPCLCLVSVLL